MNNKKNGDNMPKDNINEKYSEETLKVKNFYPAVFVVTLILIMGLGMFYVWNFDKGFSNKLVPMTYEPITLAKEIPQAKGTITPGVEINKVSISSPEIVAKGKELFKTNCASCHGDAGLGDGPGAVALNPKPRNFAVKDGWKNGRDITSIYKTLEEGIPNSGMTSYSFLTSADRFAIIHYVRTLAADFPEITPVSLVQLDAAFSVSKGKMTPNTIPVKLAMSKMIEEGKPIIEKITALENEIKAADNPGAKIFNDYTKSKSRAIASLMNNGAWKESKEKFFRIIYNSIPENGFKPCILKLGTADQNELYSFLKTKI